MKEFLVRNVIISQMYICQATVDLFFGVYLLRALVVPGSFRVRIRQAKIEDATQISRLVSTLSAKYIAHEADASLKRPAEGVYLRGRIETNRPPYRVKYGIEAFFAPKKKAVQLERELRNGGVAVLMVAGSGSVALKNVVPDTAEE